MPDTKPSAADHDASEHETRPQPAAQGTQQDVSKVASAPAVQPAPAAQPAQSAKSSVAPPPPDHPIKTLLSTFPGVLTAIGGVLAAIATLITALNGAAWLNPQAAGQPPKTAVAAAMPTTASTAMPLVIVVVATATPAATDTPPPTAVEAATEVPSATTTAAPTVVPTSGAKALLALDEDFAAPVGWGSPPGEGYRTRYDQGYADIRVEQTEVTVWDNVPLERPLANQSMQVDAWRAADSADGYYGLVVREEQPSHFYLFAVSSDGWYVVQRCDGDDWLDLVPWTESELVLQGEATNRLRVECHGGQMRFFVNGTLVEQVQDLTYTAGKLGLLAGSFDEVPVEVMFDNLMVRELADE